MKRIRCDTHIGVNSRSDILSYAAKRLLSFYRDRGIEATFVRSFYVERDTLESVNGEAYFAVRSITSGQVYAAIVPCVFTLSGSIMRTEPIRHETDRQNYDHCPPYILEVLTPTWSQNAIAWRRRCARRSWRYVMRISMNADGSRNIQVSLHDETASVTLHERQNIGRSDFPATYEVVVATYPMAEITTS